MNDVTNKFVNILQLTWESPTRLWTFKISDEGGRD